MMKFPRRLNLELVVAIGLVGGCSRESVLIQHFIVRLDKETFADG